MKNRTHVTLALAIAAIVALSCSTAAADPVVGTVDGLMSGGELYIPLKSSTSGELGDYIGHGDHVGHQSDSVDLHYWGTRSSSGWVSFEIAFDLNDLLEPGEVIDPSTAALRLVFDDIDFKADDNGKAILRETLSLSFRPDAGGSGRDALLLNEYNYGNYTASGFTNTDDRTVTYEVSLMDDLGVTAADFQNMSSDGEFAIAATFASDIRLDGYSTTAYNTPEAIGNSFTFVGATASAPVPEPATLALLGVGGVAMAGAWHRRRRLVQA